MICTSNLLGLSASCTEPLAPIHPSPDTSYRGEPHRSQHLKHTTHSDSRSSKFAIRGTKRPRRSARRPLDELTALCWSSAAVTALPQQVRLLFFFLCLAFLPLRPLLAFTPRLQISHHALLYAERHRRGRCSAGQQFTGSRSAPCPTSVYRCVERTSYHASYLLLQPSFVRLN